MAQRDEGAVQAVRDNFERFKRENVDQMIIANRRARQGVNSARTRRLKAYSFAERMLPHLEKARNELWEWPNPGSVRLANWLNDNNITRDDKGGFHQSTIDDALYGVANVIAKEAVMECRTRMTARAMRADFDRNAGDAHELETECVSQIAEAIKLSEELQGFVPSALSERLRMAKETASDIAKQQRRETYFSMIAREVYMTDDQLDQIVPEVFALER